jgi:hypothetical protein
MPSGEVTGPGVRLRELTQHSYGVRVTLDIRFAYVSTALAAALIFSVGTGWALGPPSLSEEGSRYFLGMRW